MAAGQATPAHKRRSGHGPGPIAGLADSPVAKIIMLAAAIALTAAVVFFAWNAVGENTPSDVTPDDASIIKNEKLCNAAGGTWTPSTESCSSGAATTVAPTTTT